MREIYAIFLLTSIEEKKTYETIVRTILYYINSNVRNNLKKENVDLRADKLGWNIMHNVSKDVHRVIKIFLWNDTIWMKDFTAWKCLIGLLGESNIGAISSAYSASRIHGLRAFVSLSKETDILRSLKDHNCLRDLPKIVWTGWWPMWSWTWREARSCYVCWQGRDFGTRFLDWSTIWWTSRKTWWHVSITTNRIADLYLATWTWFFSSFCGGKG